MNCRLFAFDAVGITSSQDVDKFSYSSQFPIEVGDILKWWGGNHYAVSIGEGEVLDVPEWGGSPRRERLTVLIQEMDQPIEVWRKRI